MALDIDKAIKQAEYYHDNNMERSALLLWEAIVQQEPSAYREFKYADALRLCGFSLKAEHVFLGIDYNDIPAKYKYLYHLYFGRLYMDMGNTKQAKEQLLACMEFEHCDTVPYVFLAMVLKPDRDNAEAIYYLTLALEKEGDIDEVYYNLSTRLAIKGDMQGALDTVNKCLAIDPNYPNALNLKKDMENYLAIKGTADI